MKLSARNILKCKIKQIKPGAVDTEVVLQVTAPAEMVSVITKESAEHLGLSNGKEVYAVIKASNVMLGIE